MGLVITYETYAVITLHSIHAHKLRTDISIYILQTEGAAKKKGLRNNQNMRDTTELIHIMEQA